MKSKPHSEAPKSISFPDRGIGPTANDVLEASADLMAASEFVLFHRVVRLGVLGKSLSDGANEWEGFMNSKDWVKQFKQDGHLVIVGLLDPLTDLAPIMAETPVV